MIDVLDKRIIAAVQTELPLVPEPYREIAERLHISTEELLNRLRRYKSEGQLRKMGVVIRHRQAGYQANALCAWCVPKSRLSEIGELFAESAAVSHCYERVSLPDWPYNLYTMLHAQTREGCQTIAAELAQLAKVDTYILLFSTRELKKSSMCYFKEGEDI